VRTSYSGSNLLDEAVHRLKELVEGRGEASSNDLEVVVKALERFVRGAYPGIAHEAADVAEEAVVRFVQAIRRGRLDENRSPAAYLITIARNEAVSRLRSPRREPVSTLPVQEDPLLYGFLERQAARSDVESAWQKARRRQDTTVLRVVSSWLDLAAQLGRRPTSREVGRKAAVSHTAVRQALERFRSYFPEQPPSA
jgi:DNA-directed RNA polymerase specialized sigma24 family protein